ncbi:sulfurtransferase [Streptomyces sp. P38-E01]|uniref:Sulfurtransferase n=1 Tax=Streptomyces tardus TaxID=2780544 RepID=A0A949NAB4_9ACTN|nr:sulfurtransferase [Streptomyces tardus]
MTADPSRTAVEHAPDHPAQEAEAGGIDAHLAALRATLERPGPAAALAAVAEGAVLVDTRPADRRRTEGAIAGALVVERNHLEWRLDPYNEGALPQATDLGIHWIVFCDEGYASTLAAASLRHIGLTRATDLDGGFRAWRRAGLPVLPPTGDAPRAR